MQLGAEPKQVAIFAGLIVLAGVLHFTGDDGRPSGPTPSPAQKTSSAPPVRPAAQTSSARPAADAPSAARGANRRAPREFKPVLRPRRVEDRLDPATIDPTLRTELLARLATVRIEGGQRPLFDFSAAPPPKAPDPGKIIPTKPVTIANATPVVAPPPKPTTPVKPTAPPVPLKFYGFSSPRGAARRAFFLDGEDVHVVNEGDIIKRRYKVVRINLNSVVMEDTNFKQQQTVPMVEQMP